MASPVFGKHFRGFVVWILKGSYAVSVELLHSQERSLSLDAARPRREKDGAATAGERIDSEMSLQFRGFS